MTKNISDIIGPLTVVQPSGYSNIHLMSSEGLWPLVYLILQKLVNRHH